MITTFLHFHHTLGTPTSGRCCSSAAPTRSPRPSN
jgi:hypothetical protein